MIKKGKKILSFIDDLDENLTESFHIKKKIWLVFTGIILLNILTDFILLILPVFLGINKNVYLNTYSSINILKAIGMLFEGKFSLFLAYIYNFIALSFVSFGGTMLWYELFKGKKISIKKKYIPIYFVSLFILLIKPLFYIGNFSQKNIIGVSASFNYNLEYLNNLNLIILISSILYFIIYKIKNKISMKLIKIPFLCFVTYYLFFFLISIVNFYTKSSSLICDSTNCMYTKVFEFLSSIDIYSPITIYMVDFFQIIIKILELNFFLITLIFYAYGYFIFVKKLFETKIELI